MDNINIDLLLNIDVNDLKSRERKELLKLSDLQSIDWNNVATDILGITDPIGQLANWLSGILSSLFDDLKKAFETILNNIIGPVSSVVNTILSIISGIPGAISNLLNIINNVVVKPIQDALYWVSNNFPAIITAASSLIANITSYIANLPGQIKSFIDTVSGFISDLGGKLTTAFSWFINQVSNLPSTISDLIGKITGIFSDLAGKIQAGFSWFIDQIGKIPSIISDLASKITSVFSNIASAIQSGLNFIASELGKIPSILSDVFAKITGVFSDLAGKIQAGFSWFIDQVTHIPDYIRDLIGKVTGFFGDLIDKIKSGFSWFIDQIVKIPSIVSNVVNTIIGDVSRGIGGAIDWIKNGFNLVSSTISTWFTEARDWFTQATKVLQALGADFMGFVNGVIQLPDRLRVAFQDVTNFFARLENALASFIRDPFGTLKTYIFEPLWNGLTASASIMWSSLSKLGAGVWEALSSIWDKISAGVSWLWDALKKAAQWFINGLKDVYDVFSNLFTTAASEVIKVSEAVYGFFVNTISNMQSRIADASQKFTKSVLSSFMTEVGWGSPPGLTVENFVKAWSKSFEYSIPIYLFAMSVELPLRASAYVLRGIALSMRDLQWTVKVSLKPFGLGTEFEFNVAKAIGASLFNFADELTKHAEKFYEPIWMGIGFWYGRYTSMLLTYSLRNYIPIEIPTLRESEEIWNKLRSTKTATYNIPASVLGKPEDAEEALVNFLKIKGFSDYLIKMAFADEDEFNITIKDRFLAQRKIPLADAWKLPAPTDIITMMIRDVFPTVEDFFAIMRAAGFNKDTAILYYYLHYRYPPPERLAEFYFRGLAGVLWYPSTLFEQDLAADLGLNVSAKAPKELNFSFGMLNEILNRYMKWHDYAPFPWISGAATDKAIMSELMAKLPEKVEYRWMVRWGVLQHLSALGVGVTTPIEQIITAMQSAKGNELLAQQVTPGISLDASLLSRFFVAAGMHPVFASISAVTDSHTMLADEMILLRTGFIALYRYGIADINIIEQLMSGLITVQFTTAYLDLGTGAWKTLTYNKPIFWLPAERRLLQLRTVMDRYTTLFRSFIREVERGVRTLLLMGKKDIDDIKSYVNSLNLPKEDADKVKALLSALQQYPTFEALIRQYYDVVSQQLSSEVKSITGQDIGFDIDEKYISVWMEYAELSRVIEVKRWVRTFATRIMGWLFYRVSYGWVRPEEYQALTSMLVARGWISIEEKQFLDTVSEWIYGIAKKEMAPSPSQLSSFAEYMVLDAGFVKDALNKYNVPAEYQDLWIKYISIKPVKSDYKALITAAIRALRYNVISRDEWSKIIENAKQFGFTDKELALIQQRTDLELAVSNAHEYIPTPNTLATMSEYLPEVRNYINNVLEARKIGGIWAQAWTKYIYLKPVYDNVRQWANAMFNLAFNLIIDMKQLDQVFSVLKTYGWEDLEITISQKTILANQIRYAFNDILGAPRTLAAMSRYTDKAADQSFSRASKLIDSLPVDANTKELLKQMYKEYIMSYQAYPEIRSYMSELITDYAYGLLDDTGLEQELDYLRKLGTPELRLALVKRTAQLRRMRRLATSGS
jgi:phage-related protein